MNTTSKSADSLAYGLSDAQKMALEAACRLGTASHEVRVFDALARKGLGAKVGVMSFVPNDFGRQVNEIAKKMPGRGY